MPHSEETLRAASTTGSKENKGPGDSSRQASPDAFLIKITSGLFTCVHTDPAQPYSVLLVKGLPASYTKSRNPVRNFWVLVNSTSHCIMWSPPTSLGPNRALTPERGQHCG